MPSEREVGLDPIFDAPEARLIEPAGLRARELLVRDVRQRRAAPEPECRRQEAVCGLHPSLPQLAPPTSKQFVEARGIELAVIDAEEISARPRLQTIGGQRATNLGDVDPQELARRGRRTLAPQDVDQGIA